MPLLSLPHELILLIAEKLDRPRDFLRLISLNRFTYNLLLSDLYKRDVATTNGLALTWYADRGLETGVRAMLAAGASPDLHHPLMQRTPLLIAIRQDHAQIVKLLLENGASPNLMDAYGNTPLILSISRGLCDGFAIPQLLLDHGADINLPGRRNKRTPLCTAVQFREPDMLRFLLDRGSDINFREYGKTMLHFAIDKARPAEIVKLLVGAGIEVDCLDSLGITPLMLAASDGASEPAKALLDYGANMHFSSTGTSFHGWTALHFAATSSAKESVEVMRLLIDHGAIVDAVDTSHCTPLHMTRTGDGSLQLKAQLLLDHGADLHARDNAGLTVLHKYAKEMQPDLVKWACEQGLDVNCRNPINGDTALHSLHSVDSYLGDKPLITQVLLDLGADVDSENSQGVTPLCLASGLVHDQAICALLQHGANINHKDHAGLTPLHWAAGSLLLPESRFTEPIACRAIKILLQHGAELNARSLSGQTPLGLSSEMQVPRVTALLRAGGIE